jgi:predicted PurR-regulated permease PerM
MYARSAVPSTFETPPTSPNWGSTTKLVVGLTFVAIVAALVINVRAIIGPLVLAFLLAYVLHPLAVRLSNATRLNWRMSVNLVFLTLVVLLVAFSTLAGLAMVQQIQGLIRVLQNFINTLPDLAAGLSGQVYVFGPFQFNLSQFDLQLLSEQLLSTLQPLLGRLGTLVSTFAASAAGTFAWVIFILIIAYFLLAESNKFSNELVRIEIPGHDYDVRRLTSDLMIIWNSFLRGQLVIFILAFILNLTMMTLLGVRYALGIALLAGLAKFVPYVGPLVVVIVVGLVAVFQGQNYFGLLPLHYALLVVALTIILDQTFDNLVTPRLLGQTLGVHPAAVLTAAIIAANLIGVIGLILAAPVLATAKLLGRYVTRKMLDLDPWPETDAEPPHPIEFPWAAPSRRLRAWWQVVRQRDIMRKR